MQKALRELAALDARHRAEGVTVLGVSVDEDAADVAPFARSFGVTFDLAVDEGHRFAAAFDLKTMPSTFVMDARGEVRHRHDGYHDGDMGAVEREAVELADQVR